ncbi:potassium-transporting ATPase subunit KdpA [Peribacillus simplex]
MVFFRGLTGQRSLGNFYLDLIRTITRVLLPLSILIGGKNLWVDPL